MTEEIDPYSTGSRETLANILCPFDNADLRRRLEAFRIEFEEQHGPTDLTRRYTSMYPVEQGLWMQRYHPTEYWNGLPPFAQAFLKDLLSSQGRVGSLDDCHDALLRLYVAGVMRGDDGRGQCR